MINKFIWQIKHWVKYYTFGEVFTEVAIKPIKRFFRGIKRIWDFAPIAYKDQDWDHTFLYDLLIFKLNRMEKFFNSGNAMCSGNERRAKQMRYAIFLLKRIKEDRYHEDEYDALEEKWEPEHIWTPDPSNSEWSRLDIVHNKAKNKEEEKQAVDDYRAHFRKQAATLESDLDRLFKHMRRYVQGWWD